jgi:hypothetical protein
MMRFAAALAQVAVTAIVTAAVAAPALAESCTRSRDFLADSSDMPQKPQVYQELYRTCIETLQLSNVKDAFILKAGVIAVIPNRDTVPATARTLAQFCGRYPRGTLHFIGAKQRGQTGNIARAVEFSPERATPCQKITGG